MKDNLKNNVRENNHHENMTEMKNQNFSGKDISGKDMLKYLRPDLFSDTQHKDVPYLQKEMFEYHLDTLTNRKQEYQFEHFCRKLAEKEICPNLRTQTGPTGGGDSKVDSETYPVAEEIAERWWIGSPSAGYEQWAFAFSAKKDWKPKLKSDVNSILSTNRNYKRIYFFTNQFVKDKDRSATEDKLSKELGISVHIMDRAWIVEKVYESDPQYIDTYFAALGIDAETNREIQRGPQDTVRLEELEELDRQIDDPSRYQGAQYQLVEDCLRSAILARNLERPRSEVEGRFVRAYQLSLKLNHYQQRLRIIYDQAWTAFAWYEDYATFNKFYDIAEKCAEHCDQASDLELLCTLWGLLPVLISKKKIQDVKFESRSQRLKKMLQAMVNDSLRPNNSLEAETKLVIMLLSPVYLYDKSGKISENKIDDIWREMAKIIDKSEGLWDYPIEKLFNYVEKICKHLNGPLVDGAAFDMFYEKLVNAIKKRRSDGEAGIAYAKRAKQKMEQEKPYEAIQWFGRAEKLLVKDEYKEELIETLIESSDAFEGAGLLWAARNKALVAVNQTLAIYVKDGQIIPQILIALNKLTWIELKLGRIPQILDTMILANRIALQLNLSENEQKSYVEVLEQQDRILGIHFLNLPIESLSKVTRLPDTLQQIVCIQAWIALMFVLGHEKFLREKGCIPTDEDAESVQSIFEMWQDQPVTKDIAPHPVLVDGKNSVLKSTIFGTEIVVKTPNNVTSFCIAESLLGTLETLIATADEQHVFPYRECITIVITSSNQLEGTPQIKFSDTDSSQIEIIHPANFDFKTGADIQKYMKWLQNSIAEILPRMMMVKDAGVWFERGLVHAFMFSDILTFYKQIYHIFRRMPLIRLKDWIDQNNKDYPVLRSTPWRPEKTSADDSPTETQKASNKFFSDTVNDKKQLKHTDRRIRSVIDIPLWDKAQWGGILFGWRPDAPPNLWLGFKNRDAGKAIFRAWQNRWGKVDDEEILRIAIITGVSKKNPAEYAVLVGTNLQCLEDNVAFVSRTHRMIPNTSTNLDNFIKAYKKAKNFLFGPVQMNTNGEIAEMPSDQLAISKKQIDIREAWQIGENDPDIVALRADDDPIIPPGVVDAPINKAMMRIRSCK